MRDSSTWEDRVGAPSSRGGPWQPSLSPRFSRDRARYYAQESGSMTTFQPEAWAIPALHQPGDNGAFFSGQDNQRIRWPRHRATADHAKTHLPPTTAVQPKPGAEKQAAREEGPEGPSLLPFTKKFYCNNDQTFHESYWENPPNPPASALHNGPFTYPRKLKYCNHERKITDLEEFCNRPVGGQGNAKLLKARFGAELSWGYEWVHTVLIAKGRSCPSMPTLVIILWSVLWTVVCMVPMHFDAVKEALSTGDLSVAYEDWERHIFMVFQGLQIPLKIMGFAVTFLLVFRTDTAYKRWWEGRTALDNVVMNTHDLARQIAANLANFSTAEKMMRWLIVTMYMLKKFIRDETDVDEVRGVVSDQALNFLERARNKPLAAAQRLSELLAVAIATQDVYNDMITAIDLNISDLINSVGHCETIITTSMPFAYVVHLRTFILIWLALLPPYLCTMVGWITIPFMILITVLFLGLDSISTEIENPFGYDWNDLPVDKIFEELVLDIEQALLTMLDLPPNAEAYTEDDLERFHIRAFGEPVPMRGGKKTVRPVFAPQSLFLRQFKAIVSRKNNRRASKI